MTVQVRPVAPNSIVFQLFLTKRINKFVALVDNKKKEVIIENMKTNFRTFTQFIQPTGMQAYWSVDCGSASTISNRPEHKLQTRVQEDRVA